MSPVMTGVELLDRQIVDADELYPARYQKLRTIRCKERVVAVKLLVGDEARVSRSQQDSLVAPQIA